MPTFEGTLYTTLRAATVPREERKSMGHSTVIKAGAVNADSYSLNATCMCCENVCDCTVHLHCMY